MEPLAWFARDRAAARAARDPWANLCVLATVGADGAPRVRTLVLRDLDGELGLFVNATSPKWTELGGVLALATFFATPNVQYRLRCTTRPVPDAIVQSNWQLRPEVPKRMDWLYERLPQSSAVTGREALLADLAGLKLPEPLHAPPGARGVYLDPLEVDRLDLAQADGVHDRRFWRRRGAAWHEQVLVP